MYKNTSDDQLERKDTALNNANTKNNIKEGYFTPIYGLKQLQIICVLYQGNLANIYLVKDIWSTNHYAIKSVAKKTDMGLPYGEIEKQVLFKVNNPFLIRCYKIFESEKSLYFVLPYYAGGNLEVHLSRTKRFSDQNVKFYASELFFGLQHLHKIGFIHTNLQPNNILIDYRGHLHIVDFTRVKQNQPANLDKKKLPPVIVDYYPQSIMSEPIRVSIPYTANCDLSISLRNQNNKVTSPWYSCNYYKNIWNTDKDNDTFNCFAAPETVNSHYTEASDWWSYGLIIYSMLTGTSSLSDITNYTQLSLLIESQLNNDIYISEDAKSFIRSLLCLDPSKRLGSGKLSNEDIMNHPYLANISWKSIQKKNNRAPYVPKLSSFIDVRYCSKLLI